MDISYEKTEDGEEWLHGKDDDIRLVDVTKDEQGDIQVSVGAVEFIRDEPLESRLRAAVLEAINSVEGVESAGEEDREVWFVQGEPSGESLARSVGTVINDLYDELSAYVDTLG
jgi:hypothetical protein